VSQNLYGAGPGQGAGPACGTCCKPPFCNEHNGWETDPSPGKLTIQTNSSGQKVSNAGNSIVVKINNLCPGK